MEQNSTFRNISYFKRSIPAHIMVMGVGGAGGNAIKHMWEMGIEGVNLVACNTDQQDLDKLQIDEQNKIAIGEGLGAGNNAQKGEEHARGSIDRIRTLLEQHNTRMLFIAAGMGGGTGTGASPVIAELAHEMGILTVAIVTMPPTDEGPLRMSQARQGLDRLRRYVDSLIVLSNDAINKLYGNDPVESAFDRANDIVAFAAKGIAEISTHSHNLVNVDFSDVCTVMRQSGYAVMGVATETGDERAEKVIDKILCSPLFGDIKIAGARNVLLNISVSSQEKLSMKEVSRVKARVQEYARYEDEQGNIQLTNIIWGTSNKPNLGEDELEVIVVATGFTAEYCNEVIEKQILNPTIEHTTLPVQESGVIQPLNKPQPAATTRVATPSCIERPARSYEDIEQCKLTPAYLTQKISLTKQASGKTQAADKGSTSTTEERNVESGQTSMF